MGTRVKGGETQMSETIDAPGGEAPQGRSVAMWLLAGALVLETLIAVAGFIQFVIPSGDIDPLFFIFVAVMVTLAAFTALAMWRPRPWAYLGGGILLFLFFVLNAPFIVGLLFKPVGAPEELPWAGVLTITLGPVGSVAGIVAFRQARRGRWAPAWQARRAELLGAGFLGLLVGIFYVSFAGSLALSESGGTGVRNGIQTAPTQKALVLEAEEVKWSTKSLEAETGVVPIHVINRDHLPHTFDAVVNGQHLSHPVASGSTTTVLLEVKSPGRITYWCAISGHRGTMEGTLTVG